MSAPVTFDLEGFDELEKQLQSLSMVAQKRVLRTVVKESAAPLLPKMIANFNGNWNNDTGQLVNSFGIRATIPKNATFADAFASVGVFKNRKVQAASGKEMDAPQIAYWLETGVDPHSLGTKSRLSTSKGQNQGNKHPGIPAKPFMRPAFDSDVEKMLGTEKTLLSALIDRALQNAR
ncbi:HK97 gp10 family phage protein [Salmonella enterica subsp. enterica]|nr:HK97 gp10 family phage protein [Salmonella enterica]